MDTKMRKVDVKFLHEQLKKQEEILRNAIKTLDKSKFLILRILSCNGSFSCSFKDSWCATEEVSSDGRTGVTLFKDWFDTSILKQFLDNGDLRDVKEDKKAGVLLALQHLVRFMDNFKETNGTIQFFLQKRPGLSKAEWAALFSIHLIEKLSTANCLRISDVGYGKEVTGCPCGCRRELLYDDTSMGNKEVWHGSVDIMMGHSAIHLVDDVSCKNEAAKNMSTSSEIEMKTSDLTDNTHQLISQSIVLSRAGGNAPLVAVSKQDLQLFLYDLDGDILVESEEFDFQMQIAVHTVLALWMALNDKEFGRFPVYNKPAYCSGFKALMEQDNKLEIYENDIHFFRCKGAEQNNVKVKVMLDNLSPYTDVINPDSFKT